MRKLVITLFCITLLIPSRGNTLGLGEIELFSSLNEELKAEIPLTSVGQESAETIIVKLATRKEFARAGIDRPFILTGLRFEVKVRNGQPYIEVSSKKAIREPFLSFLLDIDWPRGHILREFTMLLDPPVFMQATPEGTPTKAVVAPQQSSADQLQPQNNTGFSEPASRNNQAFAPSAPASNVQSYQAPQQFQSQPAQRTQTRSIAQSYQLPAGSYRVQKGDTAWKIAEKLRADSSVSVEQMMMALLRRNPEAFIKENINGVKRGYILRMPNQQEVQALDNDLALTQVKQQYAQWREYRQALVAKRNANTIDRTGTTEPEQTSTATQGRLTIASAAEKEGSTGMTSGSQNPEADLKQLRQDLAATTEELESGKLENNELKDKISTLQARLKKMERLLNLKDGDLAKLQSDIEPESASDTMPAEMPGSEEAPMTPEIVPGDEMAAESEQSDTTMPTDETPADMTATETPAEMDAISSTQPADDAVFKDDMTSMEAPQQPRAAMPPVQSYDLQPPASKSVIEQFLTDPKALPYLAGGAIGVILLVLLIIIRRKKARAAEEEPVAELPESGDFDFDDVDLGDESDSGFNEKEEQELSDTLDSFAEEADLEAEAEEEAVISLDEDQSEEETQKDDVLAEADVYLAYGIYQQAEELLKTAVAENPDRNDYKAKLLETYFASKDKAGFIQLAEVLKDNINNESPEWQRVVAMGRELDSANPLFTGMGDVPDFDVDDVIPEKPDTDFDLGDAAADFDLGDAIDESSDVDLGLNDESLDDEIPATVALSADEASEFDLGEGALDDSDNFAVNEDGLDELDQELADAGIDDDEFNFGLDESDTDNTASDDEVSDEDFSLDFEMSDLGLDESAAEVSAEETEAIASALEPEIEESVDLSADLGDELDAINVDDSSDIEMDLGDLSADLDMDVADETPADAEPDLDVSLDMGDIDMGDIDLATDDLAADDASLDMGDMDIGDMDMGDIDLSADDDATVVRSMPADDDDEPIDISSLPEDLDEVNTKLDLARAYIDMGDDDGAASILREVLEEAAGDQKQQAEDMLAKIA